MQSCSLLLNLRTPSWLADEWNFVRYCVVILVVVASVSCLSPVCYWQMVNLPLTATQDMKWTVLNSNRGYEIDCLCHGQFFQSCGSGDNTTPEALERQIRYVSYCRFSNILVFIASKPRWHCMTAWSASCLTRQGPRKYLMFHSLLSTFAFTEQRPIFYSMNSFTSVLLWIQLLQVHNIFPEFFALCSTRARCSTRNIPGY